MPSLLLNISEAEVEKLSYERYRYPDPIVQKRIFAVYLKATPGWSNRMIGEVVGLHYNTVGQWIAIYKERGYNGLLTNIMAVKRVIWRSIVIAFWSPYETSHP